MAEFSLALASEDLADETSMDRRGAGVTRGDER